MKKVLILTYHWPPAGGPGVQRILKFIKYLPEFNWTPVVLTVRHGEYMAYDESLVKEIAPELQVYRTETIEPYSIYKKLTRRSQDEIIPNLIMTEQKSPTVSEKFSRWIRANIFIPDARVGWIPYIIKEGMKIIEKEKPDLIFSSSPPHSVHLGAMRLVKKTGLKWIVDFRDPWADLDIFYTHNRRHKLSAWIDARLERKVLKKADGIITINHYFTDLLTHKIDQEKGSESIPSGFDRDSFQDNDTKVNTDKFIITYAGTLSESRIPYALLPALKEINESATVPFLFRFYGTVCERMRVLIDEYNLTGITEYLAYQPHRELLKKLKESAVLLLVIDDVPHNEGYMSGKIFDYLGSKRPVYAIGPLHGEANKIITNTNCGQMIEYNDTSGALDLLKEMVGTWKNNSRFSFNIEMYEKRRLTEKLAAFFDNMCSEND